MRKKLLTYSFFCLTFVVATVFVLRARAEESRKQGDLTTYFTYSRDAKTGLKTLTSHRAITEEQLVKWDDILSSHFEKDRTGALVQLQIYTFLYAAEREAAFLSYNLKDYFEGTLDPLCLEVVRLFYPNFPAPTVYQSDEYSEKLAKTILPKFKQRLAREQQLRERKNPSPCDGRAWQLVRGWIPWIVKPLTPFLPPPPPSEDDKSWDGQLRELVKLHKKATPEERAAAEKWAHGEITNWLQAANTYIFEEDVPLAKALLVRTVLTMGLSDTMLAVFEAKYRYCTPRPALEGVEGKPGTPSYPSGHAALARSAETILDYYFPDDGPKWKAMADEAARSRLWAGVHYPIDVEAGKKLGRDIACEVIVCEGESEGS